MKKLLSYDEAKKFAISLKIKTAEQWFEKLKTIQKPKNIPYNPYLSYKNKGWVSWRDFLVGEDNSIQYFTYDEAKEFIKNNLNVKSFKEYKAYVQTTERDKRLPISPNAYYSRKDINTWIGWIDYLNSDKTKSKNRNILPYNEAEAFVHSLNIKTWKEWEEYCQSGKKPDNIPTNPNQTYNKKGWVSASKWLNAEVAVKNREFRDFKEAREFVHSLNIPSTTEWNKYSKSGKRPLDIPSSPYLIYKDSGFIDMKDWVGYYERSENKYINYNKAKKFVSKLGLKSVSEWEEYCKSGNKPACIPSRPDVIYRITEEWVSFKHWLGLNKSSKKKSNFKDYNKANLFVKKLNLTSVKEWVDFCKSGLKPKDIPSNPNIVYKGKGWVSFGEWMGYSRQAYYNVEYRPYEDAIAFVHSLNIKTTKEWKEYCNSGQKPEDIPANPYNVYAGRKVTMGEWLGTGRISCVDIKNNYMSYEDARAFIQSFNFKNTIEFREYMKTPDAPKNIPKLPNRQYKEEWKGWSDFLGNNYKKRGIDAYVSYKEAKEYVAQFNISSFEKWIEFKKTHTLPPFIPKDPYSVYKNGEWVSWGDFLGNNNVSNFNKNYVSYDEAKLFTIQLGLKKSKEWKEYCKNNTLPKGIPSDPYRTYKEKGWKGWEDFLVVNKKTPIFVPYEEAQEYVRLLNIRTIKEWKEYCGSGNKPSHIPEEPENIYKDKGWDGYLKWLGTND